MRNFRPSTVRTDSYNETHRLQLVSTPSIQGICQWYSQKTAVLYYMKVRRTLHRVKLHLATYLRNHHTIPRKLEAKQTSPQNAGRTTKKIFTRCAARIDRTQPQRTLADHGMEWLPSLPCSSPNTLKTLSTMLYMAGLTFGHRILMTMGFFGWNSYE